MKQETNIRYSKIINEIGQYVHDNIDQILSIEQLSEYVGVSKYHLNRLFYAGTGLKLGEFIQRRRMEHAYHLLAEKNMTVLDAALSVGYESVSSFSRAFSLLFNIEPGEVKRGKVIDFALPKLIKNVDRPTLLPDIVKLPKQQLIGLYGQGFEQQSYFAIAQQLYRQLAEQLALPKGLDFDQQQIIGVALDSPWRGEQSESMFFAGIATNDRELLNKEKVSNLDEYQWSAGRWAKFRHEGPYNTMWRTILGIYANWVIPNNQQLDGSAIVQHYINDASCTPSEQLLTDIYVPLKG